MQSNEQILSAIENFLAQADFPAEPELLYAPIGYSLAGGGKRLRPMLLMLAYGTFADDMQQALHDDIMDNAAVRRGKPSVHAKWGRNVAILSGDAMLIYAYRLLSTVPAELLPQALTTFNNMALEVCEGQQYDMDFEQKSKVSVVEYMHMIELKTSVPPTRTAASCGASPSNWGLLSSCRTTCWTATATSGWARPSGATSSKARRPT